ncbi:hypothetical protein [Bradyrhizobium acaciae]|uniref:hypothetical protein n=1 Tax=Bradyrhizobium acaciae TaxID=2683706 RepID=UPI001E2A34CE|nr:hypothetical protein [Bradyrhizobium acaciae]MCC8979411.1 hypothetical protein [Bradyrhizobium acaciae]
MTTDAGSRRFPQRRTYESQLSGKSFRAATLRMMRNCGNAIAQINVARVVRRFMLSSKKDRLRE